MKRKQRVGQEELNRNQTLETKIELTKNKEEKLAELREKVRRVVQEKEGSLADAPQRPQRIQVSGSAAGEDAKPAGKKSKEKKVRKARETREHAFEDFSLYAARERFARRAKHKQKKVLRKDYERLRRAQRNKIAALSVFICVMLVFAASLYFFDTHYPLNTTFRGRDVSLKPKYDKIITPLDEKFTIKGSFGSDIVLDLSRIGGEVHTTIKNNPYPIYWIENSIKGLQLEGDDEYYYDEAKLRKWVEEHLAEMQGDRVPVDARLNITDKGVEIVPEVDSDVFAVPENFVNAVVEAVNRGENEISADPYYRKASVRTSDLEAEYERVKKMKINIPELNTSIGVKEILSLYDENRNVDAAAVDRYCWALSEKYDTYNKKRKFVTHDGKQIEVLPGLYGWRMDVEATEHDLTTLLEQGGQGDLKITYQLKARQRGSNDIGNTYLELPLAEQHIYYYIDGKLAMDFPVVTGDPTRGNGTDPGVQMIKSKSPAAVLESTGNPDPRDNYRVDVLYWMPINDTGEGLHSAPWFSWEFGTNAYLGGGSHGCVNMRAEDVGKIYEKIEVGTPVVVY